MWINKLLGVLTITALMAMTACSGPGEKADVDSGSQKAVAQADAKQEKADGPNKGIGPVDHVEIGAIDESMVAEGQEIFEEKCTACHKVDQRYVGPALKGVTDKRAPEWIMNMIMNPEEMTQKDPDAKALLAEYISPMANQNISEEEARQLLEYFRTL